MSTQGARFHAGEIIKALIGEVGGPDGILGGRLRNKPRVWCHGRFEHQGITFYYTVRRCRNHHSKEPTGGLFMEISLRNPLLGGRRNSRGQWKPAQWAKSKHLRKGWEPQGAIDILARMIDRAAQLWIALQYAQMRNRLDLPLGYRKPLLDGCQPITGGRSCSR